MRVLLVVVLVSEFWGSSAFGRFAWVGGVGSGGAREIAFLIGQIERFQLRRGLLLIDEPELHLNPDLLRNWLAFLRDTVNEGQVWIATHSLEAVEVAGPMATFVFERDPARRTVTSPALLAGRPVLSALSAAVGSPAFAISRLRFIYVEGDRQSRERERFFAVCGDPESNRFLEGGSCHEVLRRLSDVTTLALETDEQLHVGGVIDRDFRTDAERDALLARGAVHVLGCHEVENLYLQPEVLAVLLSRAGRDASEALSVVQNSADEYAGLWIVQHCAANFSKQRDVPKAALVPLSDSTWLQLQAEWAQRRSASSASVDAPDRSEWEVLLDSAYSEFQSARSEPEWYRHCLGKQTLGKVASSLGFKSAEVLERNAPPPQLPSPANRRAGPVGVNPTGVNPTGGSPSATPSNTQTATQTSRASQSTVATGKISTPSGQTSTTRPTAHTRANMANRPLK